VAISIARADVKRKCMIATSDTSCDSAIDALIAEMQPAIEYSLSDEFLNDTSNVRLQAVLELGILEIIAGEFLEQMSREVGASESLSVAGFSIGEAKSRGAALVKQGWERLAPYLKAALPMSAECSILSTTPDDEMLFDLESEAARCRD